MSRQVQLLIALLCAATVSWGQQIPPSPVVRAFGDNKFWIVVEDMNYVIGSTNERIVVATWRFDLKTARAAIRGW